MMIIAHRGASGSAPENTLAAFRKAIEVGADWLELDVCTSRDGEIVVIHDDILDRTTSGSGKVRDHTLKELKRLDAGTWFGPRFAGEMIPTLAEVIALAKADGVGLVIEMKPGRHLGRGFEERLVEALAAGGMLERSIVMSFDHAAVLRIRRIEPKLRTLLLVGRRTSARRILRAVRSHHADGVSVAALLLSKKLVRLFHEKGLLAVVWTVDSRAQMRRCIARGVDGITTNFPGRLKQLPDG